MSHLERIPGRFQLLHIRDLERGGKPTTGFGMSNAEIGQGVLDGSRILAAAKRTVLRAGFVEQEPPYVRPPLEGIQKSLEYLRWIAG